MKKYFIFLLFPFALFSFQNIKEKNLLAANAFIEKIDLDPSIKKVVDKKVYYKILKKSAEEEILKNDCTVTISFNIFGEEKANLPLTETFTAKQHTIYHTSHFIPGIEKGLYGMREKEVRRIYIHPDYAFKETSIFGPNLLIIYDIYLEEIHPSNFSTY